jgi:hypothetical protein
LHGIGRRCIRVMANRLAMAADGDHVVAIDGGCLQALVDRLRVDLTQSRIQAVERVERARLRLAQGFQRLSDGLGVGRALAIQQLRRSFP